MTSATVPVPTPRFRSIDVVRGVVCALMAIDHVRVYSGVPAGGLSADVFFTRWVTHYVAPAFCFFAGTSAFFLGRSLGDMGKLAKFLVTRGLLLVVLEMTLLRFAWAFHVNYSEFNLAGVIWMLGWCMVLLGACVRFSPKAVGWAGLAIVLLQQLLNFVPSVFPAIGVPWAFIYGYSEQPPYGISVLYVIVPWIGVMMAGYGFGLVFQRPQVDRDRLFSRLGVGMTALFLIVGSAIVLKGGGGGGGAGAGGGPPFWMKLLNQQKYPASQLFLLMTLGPTIALLPLAERATGSLGRAFETLGRVPMFYYIMHLFVIHTLAIATMQLRFGDYTPDWYNSTPYTRVPPDHRWPLWLLYLVWAVALAILYPLCRWYGERKRTNPAPWMRYV